MNDNITKFLDKQVKFIKESYKQLNDEQIYALMVKGTEHIRSAIDIGTIQEYWGNRNILKEYDEAVKRVRELEEKMGKNKKKTPSTTSDGCSSRSVTRSSC